jgi:hypothetical protein
MQWEYAELSNPASGSDGVIFSHPQRRLIVDEFKGFLAKGLKAENSTNRWLHLNLGHTNVVFVAGLLGNEGWELVSHSTLTGGHEYFMFKREWTAPLDIDDSSSSRFLQVEGSGWTAR